jgi:riboflavin synthase
MFTGIIEGLGKVVAIDGSRLAVQVEGLWPDPVAVGESVAVNGCCLTATTSGSLLVFDLSDETLRRTSLATLAPGVAVNLERALRADARFGGHIVQGHVDATGELVGRADDGRLRFRTPEEGRRYLIDKGSIAIEGISLTVVAPEGSEFDVWTIPHTLACTTLGEMAIGTRVNLEYDVIAKHVENLLRFANC